MQNLEKNLSSRFRIKHSSLTKYSLLGLHCLHIIQGPTFEVVCREYPELLYKFVTVCDLYARMSPEQKQLLVNKLQEVEYTVAMCGDGANDCAALKVCFN